MLKMFMMITLINSMMFIFSKTPISMGLMLLIQTLLITFMSGLLSMNFWYSYIMFLIMMGGMLILFIYTSSLSSNQKFYLNKNNIYKNLMFILIIFMFIIMNKELYSSFNYDSMELLKINFESNFNLKMSMNKLYNLPTNMIMILMINYLLMTLFIIVEITNINMGPLRKNF